MIKLFIISSLILLGGKESSADVAIDVDKSTVTWVGKKITGQHDGTIALQSGKLIMENNALTGGVFTIDMTTINCQDLSGGGKEKLEGHLKSDDFFGVATYPTATFMITDVASKASGEYNVSGNITIKGVTKPISFTTQMSEKDGKMMATADITIDRTEFGIRYGSGSFFDNLGDKTIYDDFTLSVQLVTE